METTPIPPPPLPLPLLALKESPNVQVQLPVTCESDDVLISELLKRWIEQQEGSFLVTWKNSPTILQQGPQYLSSRAWLHFHLEANNSYFLLKMWISCLDNGCSIIWDKY